MVRISHGQLFCLVCLFMLGSAWLFALGAEAKEDAWLAMMLGLVAGLGLNTVYLLLQRRHPAKTLVEYLPAILGPWLGKLLAFVYLVYFLYISARVTRDFTELTVTSILPDTPPTVITLVEVLLAVYAVAHGPEVLARVAQAALPLCLGLVTVATLFVLREFQLTRMEPFGGAGLPSILRAAFPTTVTVPYGEGVLFGMIFPAVRSGYRWSLLGGAFMAGLVLTGLTVVEEGVLGSHLMATSQFPLLDLVRQISVGGFLERLDVLIVLVLTLGGFIKAALFLYGAVRGLAQWLGLDDHRPLTLPVGLLMAVVSMAIADNYPEHIQIGLRVVPWLLHIPLQIAVPVAVLLVAWARHLLQRAANPPGAKSG